jgi:hypothetical protein
MNPANGFEARDIFHQLADVGALVRIALALSRQFQKFAPRLGQQEFQAGDLALSRNVDVTQMFQRTLHWSLPTCLEKTHCQ